MQRPVALQLNESAKLIQSNLAISNSVNSKSSLFRRKIECPWIYPSPLRFPGYFEAPLFRTFYHFPWDFEIAGFDCSSYSKVQQQKTHKKRVNVTVAKPMANSNDCPLQMRLVEQHMHGKTRRQNPKEVSGLSCTLGQDTCKKLQARNYFWISYSFVLKLSRMVELCIPKILRFLFFDFNGFWRENDVTRLTAKLKFQDMATKINNFERTLRDRNKCEKIFGKAQLV